VKKLKHVGYQKLKTNVHRYNFDNYDIIYMYNKSIYTYN
jgi:hypothetical protein